MTTARRSGEGRAVRTKRQEILAVIVRVVWSMSLVRIVNLNVQSPAAGSAMSPTAWKSVIRSSGTWIGSIPLAGSAAVPVHSTTVSGLLSGVYAYRWIELLPTVAGKMSTCSAMVLLVSVWDTVLLVVAVPAASAVRGGAICTSAEVTPSTTAMMPSSTRTTRRNPRGAASAVRARTIRRETAATPSTHAASPTLIRISRPYVLENRPSSEDTSISACTTPARISAVTAVAAHRDQMGRIAP